MSDPKGQLQRLFKLIGFEFDRIKAFIAEQENSLDPDNADYKLLRYLSQMLGLGPLEDVDVDHHRMLIQFAGEIWQNKGTSEGFAGFPFPIIADNQIDRVFTATDVKDPEAAEDMPTATDVENEVAINLVNTPDDITFRLLDLIPDADSTLNNLNIYVIASGDSRSFNNTHIESAIELANLNVPATGRFKIYLNTRHNIDASLASASYLPLSNLGFKLGSGLESWDTDAFSSSGSFTSPLFSSSATFAYWITDTSFPSFDEDGTISFSTLASSVITGVLSDTDDFYNNRRITFDGNITSGLAGVSRIITDFRGDDSVIVYDSPLPTNAAVGDTFTIDAQTLRLKVIKKFEPGDLDVSLRELGLLNGITDIEYIRHRLRRVDSRIGLLIELIIHF